MDIPIDLTHKLEQESSSSMLDKGPPFSDKCAGCYQQLVGTFIYLSHGFSNIALALNVVS